MDRILFLAHTEVDGTVAKPVLETLPAALGLAGDECVVGLVGRVTQPGADQLAGCGATRFVAVEGDGFGESRYATDAAAVEALCRASEATLILAPHTSRWARALPGVAGRLGGRVDTHATEVAMVNGVPAVTRWFYRQRMEGLLTRRQRPWFVTVEGGGYAAYDGPVGQAVVEKIAVQVETRTTVTGARAPEAGEETIRPDAQLLFVAGAGWTKKQADGATHAQEAEQLILGMLKASGASLGGSKSLVDLSGEGQSVLRCMTHLNQVGQTGSTPRHAKGLATCCHGEEPHVVGWRFISERRAVNLDANCGWARGKADVLYVADAFEVMRIVNRMLEAD